MLLPTECTGEHYTPIKSITCLRILSRTISGTVPIGAGIVMLCQFGYSTTSSQCEKLGFVCLFYSFHTTPVFLSQQKDLHSFDIIPCRLYLCYNRWELTRLGRYSKNSRWEHCTPPISMFLTDYFLHLHDIIMPTLYSFPILKTQTFAYRSGKDTVCVIKIMISSSLSFHQ